LMKNNLDKREYVLLTNPVIGNNMVDSLPAWYSPMKGMESYDVGQVQFYFSDLSNLHNELPEVTAQKYNLAANTFVAFTEERIIKANIKSVFSAIYDLPQRMHWIDGVKAIEMVTNDHVHRIGTKHRCVLEKDSPVIVTESVRITEDKVELVEMEQKGGGGCRYTVTRISDNESKLSVDLLVKNNFVMKVMFNALMKTKYQKSLQKSLENLEKYLKTEPVEATAN
jgi:carbon monoxide dehydrogenase subunit G